MERFREESVKQGFPELEIEFPAVGFGTFKTVYQCRKQGNSFALKILHDPLVPSELESSLQTGEQSSHETDDRVSRELNAMKSIDHDNIVRISVGPKEVRIDGKNYLAYLEPFYADGTLGAVETHDEKLAIRVLTALASAIDYLWNNLRIVHRDIKPDNIAFTADGSPILLDLGIALHTTLSPLTDSLMASPRTEVYAAPEQFAMRRFTELDHRTDQFAIGLCVYQAATGRHPFWLEQMTLEQLFERMNGSRGEALEAIENRELRRILDRLLMFEVHRRYRKTEHILNDIARLGD